VKPYQVSIPPRPDGFRVEGFAVDHGRFSADIYAGTIEIFDSIGDGGTTPARISGALRSIGPRPVVVEINSPGGDVFAGLTIFNQLRAHTAGVTVRVLGLAASAAAVIAMAGDRVEMARASEIMVHRSQGIAVGNVDVLNQVAAVLAQLDGVMADIFAQRSDLPREQIVAMLVSETFLTAEDAIALGLADTLIARDATPPPALSASAAPSKHETKPTSTRDLEHRLHAAGLPRRIATREAGKLWPELSGAKTNEIDADAIASAIAENLAAHMPPNRFR